MRVDVLSNALPSGSVDWSLMPVLKQNGIGGLLGGSHLVENYGDETSGTVVALYFVREPLVPDHTLRSSGTVLGKLPVGAKDIPRL